MTARDATRRFGDRVEAYARARPGYPAELLDELVRSGTLRPTDVVADVGSGTGKLTGRLLDRAHAVHAVEPDPAMRAAAERHLGRRRGFASVAGRAEATGLPAAGVDLIVAAQAFHWFDREAARGEFVRILRPGGRLALVWNDRADDAGPFMRAYEALLQEHGTDYVAVDHRRVDAAAIEVFFAPERPSVIAVRHARSHDRQGLRDRVLSCSYVPGPGEPGHEALCRAIDRLFDEHAAGGRVALIYDARAWHGSLVPRPRSGE